MSSLDAAPDIDYQSQCVNEEKSINEVHITKENEFNKIFIVEQHFDVANTEKAKLDSCIKEKGDPIRSRSQISDLNIPLDKRACPRCTFHNDLTAKICSICQYEIPKMNNTKQLEHSENKVNEESQRKDNGFIINVKPTNLAKVQSQQIIDPRDMLSVDEKVEVYSESANRWCQGKIYKIYRDSSGIEWLTCKYAKHQMWDSVKDIGRYSENLRPNQVDTTKSIVMCQKNITQLHDTDNDDIEDDEFIKLFSAKTRLNTSKPDYFIQVLSILEENVTIRLDVTDVNNEEDRKFNIKDVDKDIILGNIIIPKNCTQGICKLFIYDDIVGDSYRIAIFDRIRRYDMLSNDLKFTKYIHSEYPPPKPINIDTIIQIIQDDQRLLFWNIEDETYGDDISYKIVFENEKSNDEIVKTLPYSLRISKYSQVRIRIKTLVTIFEDEQYQLFESKASKQIHIQSMQDVLNERMYKKVKSLENESNDNLQRIASLEKINTDRQKYFLKLNVVMDNILNNNSNMKIFNIYQDKYLKIFFETFVKEVSMSFYDAQAINSAFISHNVPINKHKKLNAMNKITEWAKTAVEFAEVPFASNAIRIYKNVSKYGYDKYVLKISAKNTYQFELKYCQYGGMNFAKRIGVNIVESDHVKQLIKEVAHSEDIKDNDENEKEKEKKIIEKAKDYSDYLLRLISTGSANKIISKSDDTNFINQLTLMVSLQSLKREHIKWTDAWNRNDMSDLTKKTTKESKDLLMELYQHFETNEHLQNIIHLAKSAANEELKQWGYDNIQIL